MAVVGTRDGKPYLDCPVQHHANTPTGIWDEAHMAAMIRDVDGYMHDHHLGGR